MAEKKRIEKKKVAVLIHSLRGGGAERVAANLMNHLSDRYSVTAFLLNDRQAVDYEILPSVVTKTFRDRLPYRLRRWKLPSLDRALNMKKTRKDLKVCACISFLETGNYYNIVSRGQGKTIISIRNHTSKKVGISNMPESYVRMKKLDRYADVVVAVSEDVAEDVIRNYGIPRKKVRVIRNWVDREEIRARAEEEIRDPAFEAFREVHPFLFITSGRLDIQKGHWHLFRAFREVHKKHPEAGLVVLGQGHGAASIQDRLEEVIRKNGLEKDVLMAGRKENPFAWLKAADVFVLSSLYEGFSNAMLEAMAVGLPVIADDCAGTRECLTPSRPYGEAVRGVRQGEYGIVTEILQEDWPEEEALTPAEDALRKAMEMMCEDEELRQAYAEKSLARTADFSPEVIVEEWVRLIEE